MRLLGAVAVIFLLQYRVGCDCGGPPLRPIPQPDAGEPDGGEFDAGLPDAGAPDAGVDAGPPDSGPPPSACSDGLDNDNDGLVDFPDDPGCTGPADTDESNAAECDAGETQPCGSSTGVCRLGLRTCANALWSACDGGVRATAESCNGLDDNCNGVTDDGVTELCTVFGCAGVRACLADAGVDGGQFSACLPLNATAETCNGVDDNCNGLIDDGIVAACTVFGCAGTHSCIPGGDAGFTACVATNPQPETCNGVDDNCNGVIDEGLSRACYTGDAGTRGVGLCKDGTETCAAGVWGPMCSGQVLPVAEVCGNGFDEACNGPADEPCDSGSCSVNGAWQVDGGPLAYTCAFGLVNISITQFTFSTAAGITTGVPSPTWSPGATRPLKGPAVGCPSGAIDAGVVYAGGCTETYDLKATVTGPQSFSGVMTMKYTGSCFDCVDQALPVQGFR